MYILNHPNTSIYAYKDVDATYAYYIYILHMHTKLPITLAYMHTRYVATY